MATPGETKFDAFVKLWKEMSIGDRLLTAEYVITAIELVNPQGECSELTEIFTKFYDPSMIKAVIKEKKPKGV